LKTRTVKNLRMVGLAQVFSMGLSQVGLLILTQLLNPTDIGLYAIILVVYNLALVVSTLGLDSAAVQSKENLNEVLRTSMTIRLIGMALSIGVILIIAPLIADFYGRPEITEPLRVFSFNLLIVSLGFASTITLTRTLRFPELSISKAVNASVWFVVALAAALAGMSYWSLVVAFMVGSVAAVSVLLYYSPYRVRLGVSKETAKSLLGYGKFPVATSIIVFLSFNLDKVIVGKWLGPELLGAYFLAYTWGTIVPNIFTSIVNTVMFPTYTHIVHDDSLLSRAYLSTLTYLAYVSLPISVGLAAISSVFVVGVLGPQWHNATLPLAIFSFVGLCSSLTSPAGNVFLAKARPDRMWRLTWVGFIPYSILLVPAVIYGGLAGVSLLMLAIAAFMLIWVWFVASSLASTCFRAIVKNLWVPTLCASVMGLVVYLVSTALTPNVLSLVALLVLGVLLYVGLVLVLADSDTKKKMLEMAMLVVRK